MGTPDDRGTGGMQALTAVMEFLALPVPLDLVRCRQSRRSRCTMHGTMGTSLPLHTVPSTSRPKWGLWVQEGHLVPQELVAHQVWKVCEDPLETQVPLVPQVTVESPAPMVHPALRETLDAMESRDPTVPPVPRVPQDLQVCPECQE